MIRTLSRMMAAAAVIACSAAHAAPPLPGAIFTTNATGTQVNGNIFAAKCDAQGVYLDGGPGPNAPQTAAGLPDGDYYFQVTDPSGKTLLSTDPVRNRQFYVLNGVIMGLSGAGNHDLAVDTDNGVNGARVIELCPFLDTPNNGGEYKVWVTPVADFVGDATKVDNGYSPGYFHGFIPAASKTDNFKIKARTSGPCLTIIKFEDHDGDGRYDTSEQEVVWPIWVKDPNGALVQGVVYTGQKSSNTPMLKLCNLPAGTYTVEEALRPIGGFGEDWTVSANILDNKYLTPPSTTILVQIKTSSRTLIIGNIPPGK